VFVQQFAFGTHEPLQTLSPERQPQPIVPEQTSPPEHAGAPLHVQVPPVQMLVAPAQSPFEQQSLDGMHDPLHNVVPLRHEQPDAVQASPPAHAICPLHVQVPPLQVFVVSVLQSAFVQQLVDGMHDDPHSL
jgi:hypothetical protein